MAKVVILGSGAWGSALAITLARGGHAVTLAVRRRTQLDAIVAARENAAYLPGVELPANIELKVRWDEAVSAAEVVVMATPSRYARAAITPIANLLPASAIVVSVTKGIEHGTLLTMSQMLTELMPQITRIAVLSGPGFAAEVARGKPAALVVAARDDAVAREVQTLFAVRPLRIYRSTDVVGVELGGAVKNVIAIAAGIGDGLGLGSSARAALITRGLAEIMRLADALGADRATMAGLAGLGDLVLTCTGELSRNRTLGLAIGQGNSAPVSREGAPVAEGIANAESIWALAQRRRVEMPIVAAVYRMLYEGAPVAAMVDHLLSRELKAETG